MASAAWVECWLPLVEVQVAARASLAVRRQAGADMLVGIQSDSGLRALGPMLRGAEG